MKGVDATVSAFANKTAYSAYPARVGLAPAPDRAAERRAANAGCFRPRVDPCLRPAGFGKTTLVSEWIAGLSRRVAWLSLDEGDNDFAHFVTHFIAALQRVEPGLGETALAVFHSPQLPPVEAVLASLINKIAGIPERLTLVLAGLVGGSIPEPGLMT